MKRTVFTTLCVLLLASGFAKELPKLYLIPGLGSDFRIFKKINFAEFDTVIIQRPKPFLRESLEQYAFRLSAQIDTTKPFALIGVSFGGMLAVEIAEIYHPTATILISSAKNKIELPFQYRFQRFFPVYKIIPKGFIKASSFVLQPLVEPDSKKEKTTFKAMLRAKDPDFLKRSSAMIINWNRTENKQPIYHIHGKADKTIPCKNIKPSIIIQEGSHMMALTKAEEIEHLILAYLRQKEQISN